MAKLVISVGVVLVALVVVFGTLQAEDEFEVDDPTDTVATSTAVVIAPVPTPTATSTIIFVDSATPTPTAISGFTIQVKGGDNPCRYLYMGSRVGTIANASMSIEFIAGTHEQSQIRKDRRVEALEATNEGHLYGPTGPHLFEVEDASGAVILHAPVGRGTTTRATVIFAEVGLYKLFDRLRPDLGQVGEYFARPIGQPGGGNMWPWYDWCRDHDLLKMPDTQP